MSIFSLNYISSTEVLKTEKLPRLKLEKYSESSGNFWSSNEKQV